jgi:hypothetical protein
MTNEIVITPNNVPSLLEPTTEKYEAIESELNTLKLNTVEVSDKIRVTIDEAIQFTGAAQNPKMYDSLAKLITAYSTLNKDIASVLKQKQDMYDSFRNKSNKNQSKSVTPESTDATVVDNRQIHFHGTSTELLDKYVNTKS